LFVCRAELLLHNQHKGQCAVAAAAAAAAEATAVLALQVEAFLRTPADHSTSARLVLPIALSFSVN